MPLRRITAACVPVAALAFFSLTPVGATPISTGQTVSPAALSSLSGLTLLASITGASFSTGLESGKYDAYVYRDGSTLDFVYDFSNSAGSSDSLQSATMSSFAGFTTDVYYVTGSGQSPTSVSRLQNPVVKFFFNGLIAPGQSSDQVVIKTNATQYIAGFLSVQDGGATTVSAFAPSGVPEPAPMLLLGSGLMMMGIARWGRRSRRLPS